jgi:hypothetical protein
VASQLLHSLLDLLGGNYLAKWRNFPRVHQVACLRSSTTTRTD